MPRILEIKTDERGQVWCNVGHLQKEQGQVTLLTEGELFGIKGRERQRVLDIMVSACADPDKIEDLINALPR